MKEKRIPKAVLRKHRRLFCRRIGVLVVKEMADCDVSFVEIDRRIGKAQGSAQRWTMRLIDGRSIKIEHLAILFYAIGGRELMPVIVKRESPQ